MIASSHAIASKTERTSHVTSELAPSKASWSGYAEQVGTLIAQYEQLDFQALLGQVRAFLPPPPAHVLDIGTGPGRDAAGLARLGYDVTAVDPVSEFIDHAKCRYTDLDVDWRRDALPALASLNCGPVFEVVTLQAVWMHLDETERQGAMARLAELTAPGGVVMMSLRHGPVPQGRRMFDVSGEDTIRLGAQHGFSALNCLEGQPSLRPGKEDVSWTRLVLKRRR